MQHKFITLNAPLGQFSASTGFLTYVYCPYPRLVELFGQPQRLSCRNNKIACSWVVLWDDNRTNTIYDYKTSTHYMGEEGIEPEHMHVWHVGGSIGSNADRILRMCYSNFTAEKLLRINDCYKENNTFRRLSEMAGEELL